MAKRNLNYCHMTSLDRYLSLPRSATFCVETVIRSRFRPILAVVVTVCRYITSRADLFKVDQLFKLIAPLDAGIGISVRCEKPTALSALGDVFV